MAGQQPYQPPPGLLQMRDFLKEAYRARLPDMRWCDSNNARKEELEAAYQHVRGDWEAAASNHDPLLESALQASTTDNEHQTIGMTLANDAGFWSSAGSPTQYAFEGLTYELGGPACRVVAVQIAPYRALYQEGYPVYPPMRMQVWIGPTPHTLQPASPWHEVQATDALQTFAVWQHAPIGSFLQVRMFGKLQKQREDMQFYIAVRYVAAAGEPLSVAHVLGLQPLLRSSALQLAGPTPSLPGAWCSRALALAAGFGLGPEQAALAAAFEDLAAASSSGQAQQQQWSRLVARPATLHEQQQQQQQPATGGSSSAGAASSSQQQQQGSTVQRVAESIRSILGRRDLAAAWLDAAAAREGGSSSSKRPQHQQQQEAGTCSQSPQRPPGTPLWLLEDPQQQQQQGVQPASPSGSSSDAMSDSEDEDMGEGAAAAAAQAQLRWRRQQQQAAGGPFEPPGQLLAAANRLHEEINIRLRHVEPMQQEEFLAALLADAPLHAGEAAPQEQGAHLQPHAIAVGPVAVSSGSSGGGGDASASSSWCEVGGCSSDAGQSVVRTRVVLDQTLFGSWLPSPPSTEAAALPAASHVVAATQLFQWQQQLASSSSQQSQWLQEAGCFDEGMEADARAVW